MFKRKYLISGRTNFFLSLASVNVSSCMGCLTAKKVTIMHLAWLICTIPQTPKSTGTAVIKERCCRTLNLRPFYHFRLGNEELSFLQCLKNSISSSTYSTKSSTQLSLFFSNTQLSPSPILNSLGLSFTPKLNWNFHISSLAKTASSRLGVLYRLQPFFSPNQLLSIYRCLVHPCMAYAGHV